MVNFIFYFLIEFKELFLDVLMNEEIIIIIKYKLFYY